jgi:hypothetical protein
MRCSALRRDNFLKKLVGFLIRQALCVGAIRSLTMAIIFKSGTIPFQPSQEREAALPHPAKSGHSKALPITGIDLKQPGRLRAGHLMTLFSVSHSTLYNRIRAGIIPKPDGADGTRPYWKTETVRQALQA